MTSDQLAQSPVQTLPAGMLPPGLRVYAVGDIHGRFDLLQRIVDTITRDLEESPVERAVEIYLGDYIDRGPDSRRVVDWLIKSPPIAAERICLMGNHEDLLVNVLGDPAAMSNWLFNGGAETITSYLGGRASQHDLASSESLRAAFIEALPAAHRTFFSWLPRKAVFGGYLFVHAGVRPGRPLNAQDPNDLIWIRGPFLESNADFGKMVVHGHTPVSAPELKKNRINIDTGAVFSGRLTCVALEDDTRRFLQATER